jgi:hypothetical protein
VIYLNKEDAPGGLSYHSAANDSELISFTNNLSGTSFTSATQCLNYYATQTDKVCFNRDYEGIVTNGLVLNVDAGFTPSYSRSGTTWYDVSSIGNNGTLTNGPTFNSDNGGSIVFDGVDDYVNLDEYADNIIIDSPVTLNVWLKPNIDKSISSGNIFSMGNGVNIESGGNSFNLTYGNVTGALTEETFTIINYVGGQTSSEVTLYGIENGTDYREQWVNCCLVISGPTSSSNSWKMYIDSQNINLTKGTFWSGQIFGFGNNIQPKVKVTLGATFNRENLGGLFNGNIQSFQIYNRALTSSEILQNYNAQKGRFGL